MYEYICGSKFLHECKYKMDSTKIIIGHKFLVMTDALQNNFKFVQPHWHLSCNEMNAFTFVGICSPLYDMSPDIAINREAWQ